ncbi:hypothetical protein SUDANB15_00281 [Streptomyces sp. enrichment culture]|uniref:Tat pathway signal sequence domain protein n=1 Tax=Streptomyces sp. enrichment culture TaxID=1795815 RepID=UPI003F55B340
MNERSAARSGEHRRTLRRLAAGTALALASTGVMITVTLPPDASGSTGAAARTGAAPSVGATPSSSYAPPSVTDTEPGRTTAVQETGNGVGADPLTDHEIARARRAALAGDRTLRSTSEDVGEREGTPQFLTADLGEGPGTGARSAVVLFYDYRADRAVRKTVDLATGRVVRTESATNVQPPPSGQESREALKVLLASPLGKGVEQDYRAATGQPLSDDSRLSVQGLVHEAHSAAGPADCDGTHRCVRLFTQVKGGRWIDTRDFVVDLSTRTAHRLP